MTLNVYGKVRVWDRPAELYDQWITHEHIQGQYRDQSHYHPSDIGYCIRKSILERLHFPAHRYTIPRLQRIFEHGHSTHDRFQRHFGDMGLLSGRWQCANCDFIIGKDIKTGVKKPKDCPNCNKPKMTRPVIDHNGTVLSPPKPIFLYKELPVVHDIMDLSGHTDGILEIDKEDYVIDFKTASSFAFDKVLGKNENRFTGFGGDSDSPKPIEAHVFQINIYMYVLGISKGILLYENRDKMTLKSFLIERDDNIIKEVIRRIMEGNEALARNTVPDIPSKLTDTSESNESFMYCKGFPGLPPCPFFYFCHPRVWENNGGWRQYDRFVKVEERSDKDF